MRCRECGGKMKEEYQVRSCGPHEYTSEPVEYCDDCWQDAHRGDGHSYFGIYADKMTAEKMAASMSEF